MKKGNFSVGRGGGRSTPFRIPGVTSLRGKILLLSALLVVVPGVVFALLAFSSVRQALEDAVGRQLAEVAVDAAHDLTSLAVDERNNVQTWGRQGLMRELVVGDVDKRVSRLLRSLRESDPAYVELLCTGATGVTVAASRPAALGEQHGGEEWYRAALRGAAVVQGPTPYPRLGREVLNIAAPVRHPDHPGQTIGVLLLVYDWGETAARLGRLRGDLIEVGTAANFFVLDARGVVIGGSWRPRFDALRGTDLRAAGWRTAWPQTKRNGFVFEPQVPAVVGYATAGGPAARWSVLVVQPLEEALAPVLQMQRWWVLTLFGILVAGLALAAVLAERMVRPLRTLTRATRELARSETAAQPVPVTTGDEIGQLGQAFNRMLEALAGAREELLSAAKLAFVGEMAAGIAHEVRTPLGVLRTSAQMLGRSLPEGQGDQAELVEMMIAEVDRLERVVAGLLELARPHRLAVEAVSLQEVLSRAADLIEAQATDKGISLLRQWDPAVPRAVCDPDQIYQVALNLLVNAVQHVGPGGTIVLVTVADGERGVGFEVRDDGPGIPDSLRDRVFAPFVTTREGGTGLGLALVERMVRAHHGRVGVTSEVGKGTCFRVILPAAQEEP